MKKFNLLFVVLFLCLINEKGISADYYWVGGSGDWGEIRHWATSSGGNVTYAVTPSAADNVVFDENSFTGTAQLVTINSDIAFALNLIFRNIISMPTFRAGANTTLSIYGSVTLIPQMNFQFGGNIQFAGNQQGRTINFSTHQAGGNVIFKGQGSWILNSNLILTNTIDFSEGTVTFGNNQISAQYIVSNSTTSKTINFDNAQIRLSGTSKLDNILRYDDPNSNKYTLYINASGWTSTSNNARIEMTNATSHIYFKNNGTVILPGILAPSITGKTEIINDQKQTTIRLNGDIEIRHDANIQSSMQFQNLILTPGFNYTLLGGGMYSMNSILAVGNCSSMVSINANPAGMAAIVNLTAPSNLSFTILQDIKISGAPSTANNSINLGNNSGITITEKNSQTLYWMGRTGSWSNTANWSLTSGGMSSGCLPSLIDDVVFDANSFNANGQVVTLNTLNSFCRNMIWTSVRQDATLAGRDSIRLIINGSLEFSAVMKQDYKGDFIFVGSNQHTLKLAGKKFNTDIIFNNPSGTWRLVDDIYVEEVCYLRSGKLIFENISCNFNRFLTDFTTSRSMELKNSELNFEVRNFKCAIFNLNAVNLQLDPGKSHIHFRNSSCSGMYVSGQNDIRFYNITSGCSYFSIGNFWPNNNKVNINHFKILKNAELSMRSNIDSLTVTGGHDIRLIESCILTVNNLIANNPCNSFVNISMNYYMNSNGNPTIILNKPHSFSRFSLSDISVQGSGLVPLTNSIDRGGNSGWQFSTTIGRTLYWVGGTGEWSEQIHWSLTSGGPGGECIPTEIDDVIFNNLSFSSNSDIVTHRWDISSVAYCKNLTFNKPGFTGSLTLNILNIYGNLNIQQAFNYNIYRTEFRAHTGIQTVFAPNIQFQNISIDGKAEVKLQSPVHIRFDFRVYDGIFDTNGFDMTIDNNCGLGNSNVYKKPLIKLRTSKILIHGIKYTNNEPLKCTSFVKVEGDSSRIELTNSSTAVDINSEECRFGEIVATSISGNADVAAYRNTSIRKLELRGNGRFINFLYTGRFGALTLDTLLLSAGKSYNYQSTYTQTILKYLQARGNNCNPISILSSISGQKGVISMPASGTINADFIQMKDMRGVGGANFNAGPYSTNISNSNENWIFPGVTALTATVGLLGPDKIICSDQTGINLDANSFTPNESYRWSNGSTSSSLFAQNSGNYAVTVTFANSCIVIDTIKLTKGQDVGKILPKDTSFCNQNSFVLNSLIKDPFTQYLWNNGSTDSNITLSQNGKYKLKITKDGCSFSDSIQLKFVNLLPISLGPDQSPCAGSSVALDVKNNYASVLWQNGTTQNTIQATNSGLYWAEVGESQCKLRDSVNLLFTPLPTFNMGKDTALCTGQTMVLSAGSTTGTTIWQNNTASNTFVVNSSGTYVALKTVNGCSFSDSIIVSYISVENINLGKDTSACAGDNINLNVNTSGANILWQDGSNTTSKNISQTGLYWVEVTKSGCMARDSINIAFNPIPVFNLGKDSTFCAGNSKVLAHGVTGSQTLWSNGSTQPTLSISSSGNYSAKVTLLGCSFSDTISVVIKPIPILNLGPDTSLCENDTLILNGGINGTLLWQNGTTLNTFTVTGSGNYSALKTLNGCNKSDTIIVNYLVFSRPDLGKDTSICDGTSLILSVAMAQNIKYLWSDGSTALTLPANKAGIYWLQTSIQNCKKRDSITVKTQALPKFTGTTDFSFCENKNVSITPQGDFDNIIWDDFKGVQNVVINKSGKYNYALAKGKCTIKGTINVKEIIIPTPDLGDNAELCLGEIKILFVPDFIGNIKWSTGAQTKNINVVNTDTYKVTLSDQGCTKSDSVSITLIDCSGKFLHFPNIFNPTSTSGNEKFTATLADRYTLTKYNLSVFDRYGNLIFVSENIENKWDGVYISQVLQPGVYTYLCIASADGPKRFENEKFAGTVTIVR